MRLSGAVLYLVDDAGLVQQQLRGQKLVAAEAIDRLRDDISTDEMIPARYCLEIGETLGAHCYRGLRCGSESPVGFGEVASGGFGVSVAGLRRGKGSSREHAPYAELKAGIRLVFARSFERIYRQNCHNLGLVTSTRLDLLPGLEAGEDVPLDALCDDLDLVARGIIEAGGLFPYTRGPRRLVVSTESRPRQRRTLATTILAKHASDGGPVGEPGELQLFESELRYSHEYVTAMAESLLLEHASGEPLSSPDGILLFEDHLTALAKAPSVDGQTIEKAEHLGRIQSEFAQSRHLRLHGRVGEWSDGICHLIVTERYALPGQLVVGSDSHTPHVGAIGCVAVGVGTTDIANAWVSGQVLLTVPRNLLVRVDRRLGPGVTEKDLMLQLLSLDRVRGGAAIGAIVEFGGEGITALDQEARCTLTNMTAEMGATSGIVAPDAETAAYLMRRGMPRRDAERLCDLAPSDLSAFDDVVHIDAAQVRPMVSLPGDPGNGIALAELGEVAIQRAYGGSCTAAKRRDMDMYAAVLRDALAAGRGVHPGVEFFIQAGSQSVLAYCRDSGYLELFEHAGATVLGPSCGACINAGPGASTSPTDVAVSAQNRNFPDRSGPGQLYLASPLTVAASAVAGRICEYKPWR